MIKLSKIDTFLSFITIISFPIGLLFVFKYALTEAKMGLIQKIFYFHVSSAWIGFFAFFITFLFSILFLIYKKYIYDDIAQSSAEIGLVFTTIVILTGPMWAKPVWGAYWTWDPRLTTTLILWFIYVSYLLLRSFLEDIDKRAKFSSAVGIIGFLDVPIVFLSIKWWRTIHPDVIRSGGGGLESSMLTTLFICLGIFTLLYLALLVRRLRIIMLEKRVNIIETNLY